MRPAPAGRRGSSAGSAGSSTGTRGGQAKARTEAAYEDFLVEFAGDPDHRDADYARALIALVTVLGEVESQLWGATTEARRAA
jgi:hypothetical protein